MRLASPILVALWIPACGGPQPTTPTYTVLDPSAHAVRASVVLRGLRPSAGELARVQADPRQLEPLVDEWLESDEFGEVIKDMHAEWLLVRADVIDPLPALGPLEGRLLEAMSRSPGEAPLELAKHVVVNDRPYTELVTADYTMADDVVAEIYGLDHDPTGPEWQVTHWRDGRPHAGVLSDAELWRRFESAGSNFNRLRANVVADVLLCADFASRDIVVEGGITISDEFEVANAVVTVPECVNCHQALDPLAAYFWGFKKQVKRSTVNKGYKADCDGDPGVDPFIPYAPAEYCYPLEQYSTEDEDWWAYWELRPPGFYGAPGHDLTDLGAYIAEDPRFAQCTARRFYSWMTQSDPYEVPLGKAMELQQVLVEADFSAKALARAIVLDDSFRALASSGDEAMEVPAAGVQIMRPEQYARWIEHLTGFAWRVNPDLEGCETGFMGTECWGTVDLMRSDLFGFRAMSGGINGNEISRPVHSPTPVRELVAERFSEEAAGYVVRNDLAEPDPTARRLLGLVERDTVARRQIEAQIAQLMPTLLGTFPGEGDAHVAQLADLWMDKHGRSTDTEQAWALVISAMLRDPEALFF